MLGSNKKNPVGLSVGAMGENEDYDGEQSRFGKRGEQVNQLC